MNVLITSTTFIPSVLLCGHTQLEYLQKQGKLNYKFVISHFTNKKNIQWADIIVFLRSDSDIDAQVAKIGKKANKHLVYVLDDDILNVPPYLSSAPYYLLPSTQNNIKTIMSYCDTFLTTSPILKEKYGGMFKNVFLISEPSLNRISEKSENEKIKIGFAGSIDRAKDLNQILEGTIEKLVNKYGDSIDIEIMGAKPEFVDKYNLTHLPYQDGYDAYTAFMAKCNWDIGLAPMPDSEFHKCKYFNKYVEYASFGIAGIYSNLMPYTLGIENEKNGLLVNNTTDEWYNGIVRLIEDKKLRKTISEECLRQAHDIYSLENCANDYLKKLTYAYEKSNSSYQVPGLELFKFKMLFVRLFRKVKQEGKNFPKWFIEKVNKKFNDIKQNILDKHNLSKLIKNIENQKTMFVIAPMFDDKDDAYNKRVKYIDDNFSDYYKIYISGEDRICEHLKVSLVNSTHGNIIFNSYDINQTNLILSLISKADKCLIHSVIRFMSDKISTEMYRIFDLNDVEIIWDSHGVLSDQYHELSNFHTESLLSEIEKVFYEKCDVLYCESNTDKQRYIDKYGDSAIKIEII